MISPMVPDEYINLIGGQVILEDFSQLGANSIVMPGVSIKQGAVTGAFTFVNKNLDEWTINVGIPSRKIKDRSKNLLEKYNLMEEKR